MTKSGVGKTPLTESCTIYSNGRPKKKVPSVVIIDSDTIAKGVTPILAKTTPHGIRMKSNYREDVTVIAHCPTKEEARSDVLDIAMARYNRCSLEIETVHRCSY